VASIATGTSSRVTVDRYRQYREKGAIYNPLDWANVT
jgi:hypothetical protein